ncbi:MAG: Metal dependent phosphohydrolase [Thermodesulfobacterium sp. 37_54]|jgi:hypothetical protein|uniref:Metal-dependent phosphohydrolase n=1 Tax=Thermodesulfobacterium commune TaxID=1741 RepID=A0A124FKQ8_9BACT|nr:HD domain-containing protein [Thermodesulfobacterium sp.]KUJ97383.1 MAG: Metal dependent phosphohydrolase [Thermodesulfobacterium sp. 37_54]KUK19172.1 MAG: Metal dependent phosphohydrolase [Thermodesulfobacterium commune]KUK38004.1 MAG: Metal dependent phosphohydrolase [Thermodesulfobacterium commune]MDN5378945.1 uncharacterized protein [Thermodesulfobacterium sp.]HAA84114.1 metal-dependent phosphohydrolase [Thermodesulfobacterium commune]
MLSVKDCYALLEKEQVPPHIIRHSEKVALLSVFLGCRLKKEGKANLEIPLLIAGALLHDIKKYEAILKGTNHAIAGYRFLKSLGYPQIASIIKSHVYLDLSTLKGPITEEEIVYYTDKRVKHEEIVCLKERFSDLKIRYGKTLSSQVRIYFLEKLSYVIEDRIFKGLSFGPEQLLTLERLDKEARDVFEVCFKGCSNCRGEVF